MCCLALFRFVRDKAPKAQQQEQGRAWARRRRFCEAQAWFRKGNYPRPCFAPLNVSYRGRRERSGRRCDPSVRCSLQGTSGDGSGTVSVLGRKAPSPSPRRRRPRRAHARSVSGRLGRCGPGARAEAASRASGSRTGQYRCAPAAGPRSGLAGAGAARGARRRGGASAPRASSPGGSAAPNAQSGSRAPAGAAWSSAG